MVKRMNNIFQNLLKGNRLFQTVKWLKAKENKIIQGLLNRQTKRLRYTQDLLLFVKLNLLIDYSYKRKSTFGFIMKSKLTFWR